MSEVPFDHAHASVKPGFGQTILYRALVLTLFCLSLLAVATARIFGVRGKTGFWQEAREAAYAVAGYAFKY